MFNEENHLFFQAECVYRIMMDLGIGVVSDVNPGRGSIIDHEKRVLDNSRVPLSILPRRHDSSNWLNYHSQEGSPLHIPIAAEGIAGLQRLVEKAEKNNIKMICWVIHPFEIQRFEGEIDDMKVGALEGALEETERVLSS